MVWLYKHRQTTIFRRVDIYEFMVWLLVCKRLVYKILYMYFETRFLKDFTANQNDLNVFNTELL